MIETHPTTITTPSVQEVAMCPSTWTTLRAVVTNTDFRTVTIQAATVGISRMLALDAMLVRTGMKACVVKRAYTDGCGSDGGCRGDLLLLQAAVLSTAPSAVVVV